MTSFSMAQRILREVSGVLEGAGGALIRGPAGGTVHFGLHATPSHSVVRAAGSPTAREMGSPRAITLRDGGAGSRALEQRRWREISQEHEISRRGVAPRSTQQLGVSDAGAVATPSPSRRAWRARGPAAWPRLHHRRSASRSPPARAAGSPARGGRGPVPSAHRTPPVTEPRAPARR